MHLSGLFIYPVKSLHGISVSSADVDALGLVGDRRFLVVDESGRFLTQRALPRMALIGTALTATTLTLSAESTGAIEIPRANDRHASLRVVNVWKSENLQAEDCGAGPAAWLTSFLGIACRLVRIGAAFHRPVLKSAARPGDLVSFADAAPFLAISEASLADLNARLDVSGESPVPINRFRPNLVINGCKAFAEDTWPRARIGAIVLRAAGSSTRCAITTTDQLTGARGKEPLRTLAKFRRDPNDPGEVIFGQNFIHETKTGSLRVGDQVEALRESK